MREVGTTERKRGEEKEKIGERGGAGEMRRYQVCRPAHHLPSLLALTHTHRILVAGNETGRKGGWEEGRDGGGRGEAICTSTPHAVSFFLAPSICVSSFRFSVPT
jgi:hypothetical protein